jgi:hypothetical protein
VNVATLISELQAQDPTATVTINGKSLDEVTTSPNRPGIVDLKTEPE